MFHIGTIIPESKLRHVHSWEYKSFSYSNLRFFVLQCCLLSVAWRQLSKATLGSPDSHMQNTKDLKLWKSNKNWWYMVLTPLSLLFNMVGASGLEQTLKATWSHTESILNLVCLWCFVLLVSFPFIWEGQCSSQYYHVVDRLHDNVVLSVTFECYILSFFFPFGAFILNILCSCDLFFFACYMLTRTQLNFRPKTMLHLI